MTEEARLYRAFGPSPLQCSPSLSLSAAQNIHQVEIDRHFIQNKPHVFMNMEQKITILYELFLLAVVRRMCVCIFLLNLIYCGPVSCWQRFISVVIATASQKTRKGEKREGQITFCRSLIDII